MVEFTRWLLDMKHHKYEFTMKTYTDKDIFAVVNFVALAQASSFQIEMREGAFLW